MTKQISEDFIQKNIFIIKGQKVMLSIQLAKLYEVETKKLMQAVRRNIKRFPKDFMFKLTWDEVKAFNIVVESRSQIVTLKKGKNIKYLPYAFTEQGIAMLSSVLNSDRAISVNIQIMRTFVKLRELMISHKDLAYKIEDLEKKYKPKFCIGMGMSSYLSGRNSSNAKLAFHNIYRGKGLGNPAYHNFYCKMRDKEHDKKFEVVFKAIYKLLNPPEPKKGKIGFHP